MITPLDLLLDPINLTIISIYAVVILWERILPAQKLPKVDFWWLKGMASFIVFFLISSYLPMMIDPYLSPLTLIDLSETNTAAGILIGLFLIEFAIYVYHISIHKSNLLWRVFHQMHHSSERLDAVGAFYFHPMDMIGLTVLGSLCFTVLLNIPPASITVIILLTNFFSMFQHANINTPRWLGYLIQRPESHSIHHGEGIHKYNYSDLPIFDIIFGTFKNPKKFNENVGLYYGASSKIWDMLRFKDIDKKRV